MPPCDLELLPEYLNIITTHRENALSLQSKILLEWTLCYEYENKFIGLRKIAFIFCTL